MDRIKDVLKDRIPDIAIQVRRTDNKESIDQSPFHLFEKIIKDEIYKNKDINIFLATDDMGIKNHLKESYPENFIINPVPASRSSLPGIVDAYAEMLILSQCKRIYGSYSSTFSQIASQLHGNELVVVKK